MKKKLWPEHVITKASRRRFLIARVKLTWLSKRVLNNSAKPHIIVEASAVDASQKHCPIRFDSESLRALILSS